jgi:hypothetical protein
MMSIAASFPSVKKPRLMSVRRKADNMTEGDADWLNNTPARAPFNRSLLTCLWPVAMRNLHTTQPNTLFPTCDEVINLTGLLETKGMSVSPFISHRCSWIAVYVSCCNAQSKSHSDPLDMHIVFILSIALL